MSFQWRHAHWIALTWVALDCLIGFSYTWTGLSGQALHMYWFCAVWVSVFAGWLVALSWSGPYTALLSLRIMRVFALLIVLIVGLQGMWDLSTDWESLRHKDMAVLLRAQGAVAFVFAFMLVLFSPVRFNRGTPIALAALAFGAALSLFGVVEIVLCDTFDPQPRGAGSVCSRVLEMPWENYAIAVTAAAVSFFTLRART